MNNDWTEWTYTDEKPYPETLDTKVIVKFRDGVESCYVLEVDLWCGDGNNSNWQQLNDSEDIIAYKVISE